MSVTVTFNGNTYSVPESGELGWSNLTDYLVALSNAAVSGAFTPPLKVPNDVTNNSFIEAGITGTLAAPSVPDLQSCSVSFTNTNAIVFSIALNTGESLICSASYKNAAITVLNDVDGLFLPTDAGTGIYIAKTSGSASLTFKNRMGGARNIEIKTITTNFSSITNWA